MISATDTRKPFRMEVQGADKPFKQLMLLQVTPTQKWLTSPVKV